MSTAFSTIRRLSVALDDDDKKQSSSFPSLDLSNTMKMLFHGDDSNLRGSLMQFHDSYGLSQCLQIIERTTFHKADSVNQEDDNEKKRPIPFTKKSIQGFISTSFRTNTSQPLSCIVEAISIALLDGHGESYGCPDKFKNNSSNKEKGINIKDVRNLTYFCSDLSFNPKTCTWIGKATYSCEMIVKAPNTSEKVMNSYSGNFMFSITCQSVRIPGPFARQSTFNSRDKISREDNSEISLKKHYCIDFEAILDGNDDAVRSEYDRQVLKIISQVLNHICFDVSRALYWLDLPEFPEGCKGIKFRTVYQLNSKIKSGAFATVCLGTHRLTKKRVAIKCVQRKKLPPVDDVAIQSEVGILGSIRHEFICPLIDYFIEDDCYYIVMDLMEGGDVFDRLGEIDYYDESIARDLCKKMLQAISHCHAQSIAHCDLKTKNLLLKSRNDHDNVMLADFGFATSVFAPKSLKKQCGTPYFVAPEILLREAYDTQADMWSVGVIIYCILSGSLPFTGKRHLDLFKAIIAGEFTFDEEDWGGVSDDAKDLICNLLVTNPDKRYTAADALNSKWIRANENLLKAKSLTSVSSKLRTFNAKLKLKSAILACQSVSRWRNITKIASEQKNQSGQ